MATSDEETQGPPSYNLTKEGEEKVEEAPRNPDPNFNPVVNEDDEEPENNDTVSQSWAIPEGKRVVEVRVVDTPGEPPRPETEEVDTEFYFVQKLDPARLVPGSSVYLDDLERERAEIQRAKIEDREPDLDNPGPVQSTLVLSKAVVEQSGLSTSHMEPDAVLPVVTIVAPSEGVTPEEKTNPDQEPENSDNKTSELV